jgi:hypothetical protein
MQPDPNATGMVLLSSMSFHGSAISPGVDSFDVQARFADGANLYQYLGSNPWQSSDPSGLLITMLLPGPGDFITGALKSLVSEYAARQDFDVDWATDWEMGDDWHSRLENEWVILALGQGLYEAFEIGIGQHSVNPLDLLSSASRGGRRGVSPAVPNPRLRLMGAKLMGPLNKLSPFEIARSFKDSGLRPSPHFMDRLRGVGGDPGRMASLGIRSMQDIQRILRYGTRVPERNGRTAIRYRRTQMILERDGKTLVTIDHAP